MCKGYEKVQQLLLLDFFATSVCTYEKWIATSLRSPQ